MSDLDIVRKEIEEIDKSMAALFVKRMEAAGKVAEYKMKVGLPVKDETREKQLIEKNMAYIESDEYKPYYSDFMKDVIGISCRYQDKRMNGIKIAYAGKEGAFSHIACGKFFKEGVTVSYPGFKEAYDAVENGEVDFAVLPIENSYAGEVGEVMDLMFSGNLFINKVIDMEITQNLVAKKNVSMDEIKKVISHPQALHQCAEYIDTKHWETMEMPSTSDAAGYVAESDDKTLAAIASIDAAEKYGLNVLDRNINDSGVNTTRFALFSSVRNSTVTKKKRIGECFSLVFTVSNQPGALTQALNILGVHDFNMRCLRSRPMKNLQWNYYFYLEAEGDINSENGQDMLRELNAVCDKLRLVGFYQY